MSKVWYYCNHCKQWFYMESTTSIVRICPKCGAKMKGKNNNS